MASCKVCLKAIKANQLKLKCNDCVQDFHGKCVNMGQADLDFLAEQNTVWRCDPCSKKRRCSMRLEYSQDGMTLETIMMTLKEIQEEQRTNTADFNRSYEALNAKIDENTTTLVNGMAKIEQYVKEIEQLKSENAALKTKVSSLEDRVEEMESYSRRNCLEIQGVPEQEGEKVSEVVRLVGKALNVEINDFMIDACHRVGKKARASEQKDRPRGIIVKFVRRTDKDMLMVKRRERKKDFSTRHLGMATDSPIYLNDSLSPTRRKLLAQARFLRKEKGYKYLWMRNGNILIRKEEGSPIIEVKSQADLSKL